MSTLVNPSVLNPNAHQEGIRRSLLERTIRKNQNVPSISGFICDYLEQNPKGTFEACKELWDENYKAYGQLRRTHFHQQRSRLGLTKTKRRKTTHQIQVTTLDDAVTISQAINEVFGSFERCLEVCSSLQSHIQRYSCQDIVSALDILENFSLDSQELQETAVSLSDAFAIRRSLLEIFNNIDDAKNALECLNGLFQQHGVKQVIETISRVQELLQIVKQ